MPNSIHYDIVEADALQSIVLIVNNAIQLDKTKKAKTKKAKTNKIIKRTMQLKTHKNHINYKKKCVRQATLTDYCVYHLSMLPMHIVYVNCHFRRGELQHKLTFDINLFDRRSSFDISSQSLYSIFRLLQYKRRQFVAQWKTKKKLNLILPPSNVNN